jgi:hypothetical protein
LADRYGPANAIATQVKFVILFLIIVIWGAFLGAYFAAARRDRRSPIDDIGVVFLLVLALYTTLPPLFWLLQGSSYADPLNVRLYRLQPTTAEVLQLLEIGASYAVSFGALYLVLQRKIRSPAADRLAYVRNEIFAAAVIIVIATGAIPLILGITGIVRGAASYVDSYLLIAELPLAVRQLLRVAIGISSIAQIVMLVGLLQRWPTHRRWFYLYLILMFSAFSAEGSRAPLVTGLLSVLIAWHVLVRPIPPSRLALIFAVGLLTFTLLGLRRELESWGAVSFEWTNVRLGEFDALWANAVELLQAREGGGLSVPGAAYWGEFFAFIPSQLLPFEKMSLPDWFLDEFYPYYKSEGGGWAFGAISQAIVGAGVADAALRGLVLAVICVWLIGWYRRRSNVWWRFPVYLYLVVFSFQAVRASTFSSLGDLIQIVFPAIMLTIIVAHCLRKSPAAHSSVR